MKNNRKIIIALAMIAALLLTGCGSKEAPSSKIEPIQTQPAETKASAIQPAETVPVKEENQTSLGRMEGGTYTNPYAGFGCTLDNTWTYYGAEELQTLPDDVAELLKETEMGERVEGMEQITDMMAESAELLSTVNVLYQKVPMQERLAVAAMGESAMIDAMIEQEGESLKSSYGVMGMEVSDLQRKDVTFLGKTRSGLLTTGSIEGVDTYIFQIIDYSRGAYSVTTTFTSYVEDNTQVVMDLFFPVD